MLSQTRFHQAGPSLREQANQQEPVQEQPPLALVQGVLRNRFTTILDMTMAPGAETPPHIHYRFDETFTVLAGELRVYLGSQEHILHAGESATVLPGRVHYFQNKSGQPCRVRVTVSPGNKGFEEAMFISYGLAADGLLNRAGAPKRIVDLAIFLALGDVNLAGPLQIMQPIINWVARQPFARRRLAELRLRYLPLGQAVPEIPV